MKMYHIDDLNPEEKIPGFLKNQMQRTLIQIGKLVWLNSPDGKLKVQIEHKKDMKDPMELMKLTSLSLLLAATFGQNKVKHKLTANNKYVVFEEQ